MADKILRKIYVYKRRYIRWRAGIEKKDIRLFVQQEAVLIFELLNFILSKFSHRGQLTPASYIFGRFWYIGLHNYAYLLYLLGITVRLIYVFHIMVCLRYYNDIKKQRDKKY